MLAIKAYLFSLEASEIYTASNDVAFPFNQRYLMMFWNTLEHRRSIISSDRKSTG